MDARLLMGAVKHDDGRHSYYRSLLCITLVRGAGTKRAVVKTSTWGKEGVLKPTGRGAVAVTLNTHNRRTINL